MNAELAVNGVLMVLKLNQLIRGRNPRTFFDPQEMSELVDSVRASGIAQPILVRPLEDGTYRIIAGERRVRAATEVFGEDGDIPALVRHCTTDEEDVLSLIENVDRAAMSGAEEAEQANRVLIRAKGDKVEAAAILGWNPDKLMRRLALMQLTPECRKALTARQIKLGHAELLASVPQEKQNAAMERIIAEGISVHDLKRQVAAMAKDLSRACFDTAGCNGCPFNSAQQQALFSEAVQHGACTNPPCFDSKTEAKLGEVEAELLTEVPKVIILRHDTSDQPIRLVKDGKGGVGEAQYEACKGCANYGASVSAIPGSMGEVERGLCFDAGCNLKKVAAHLKGLAGKRASAPNEKTVKQAAQGAGGTPELREHATGTAGVVTNKVKEYRVAQWRTMASKATYANPEAAMRMLVSLGLAGYSRHIDASKLQEAFVALTKVDQYGGALGSLKKASLAVANAPLEVVNSLVHVMAASAFKEIDEQRLREGLAVLRVRVDEYWSLSSEYLSLLTKSEMEALAAEVGLKEAMGEEGLKKALAQKKEQAIATLLSVEGFCYAGVVPKAMQYDAEGAAGEPSVPDTHAHEGDGEDGGDAEAGEEASSEVAEA
jgi:ParB family transcriptional regulator, chromosome partitioning protein